MADSSPGGAVALGVIVGLLSTSIQSVGLTLQRKSHMLEDQKAEEHTRRPPYRRRRWQVGMLMFLIANIVGSSIQITTLPLPVLSTLQASGLVFNTICATILLKEPFTRYSLLGTVLVAGGAVLIGIFGAMTEPSHNLAQLLDLLGQRAFLIWLSGTVLLVIAIISLGWFLHRMQHGIRAVGPKGISHIRLAQGMMYGAISGILSAHCLLVAKSAVELLVRTVVDQHNQFNKWQSWMILIALIALALSQLYYLHLGLRLTSTSVLYPFVFCIYNIIAILDGLIYFRQTSRLPVRDAVLIAVGTAILLAGVVALSWRLQDQTAELKSDGTGNVQRVRSMSRIVTPAMPQNVLAPGLGMVEDTPSPTLESQHNDDDDYDELESGEPDDEEMAVRIAHKPSKDADEATPLLRTNTAPDLKMRRAQRREAGHGHRGSGSSSLQPRKLRSKTLSTTTAAQHLWDELVEGDGYQRRASLDISERKRPFGGNHHSTLDPDRAQRSPASVRFKEDAAGTAKAAEHSRRASSGSNRLFGPARRKSAPTKRSASASQVPALGDDTDGSEDTPLIGDEPPRNLVSSGQAGDDQGPVEWFKLRWWRKRWRGDTDDQA